MKTLKTENWIMHEIDNKVIVHNRNHNKRLPFVYKNETLCEVYDKFKEMGML